LCLPAALTDDVVVVGALQLRAGEFTGLVDLELEGEPPVSLLLLPSLDGKPKKKLENLKFHSKM